MTIAALDSVLALHEAGRGKELPVPRMLTLPLAAIQARVEALRDRLRERAGGCAGIDIRAVDSAVGGGAAPDIALPSCALAVLPQGESAESLARRLREASTPIIARIEDDVVLFDLRTVLPGEDEEIERTLLGTRKGAIATS